MTVLFDIATDKHFDVQINHRGDLDSVSGREGLEQAIRNNIAANFQQLLTIDADENAEELSRIYAQRVVDRVEPVVGVQSINVEREQDEPATIIIEILYTNDDMSDLEVVA